MEWYPALAAVVVTAAVLGAGVRGAWFRTTTNFEGRDVSVAGLAPAAGVALAATLLLYDNRAGAVPLLVAVAGFAAVGAADDRWGDRTASGFRGHLRAAARGRLTTGFWKIVGGGLTALLAAWLLAPPRVLAEWGMLVLRALVIVLAANALNLLDTRPARAVAVFLAAGIPAAALTPAPLLWPPLAAAAAFLPWDRSRRAMLGDTGANALGAAAAVAVAAAAHPAALAALLIALVGLNAYTEGHSLNAEIAARPWLRRLDAAVRGPGGAQTAKPEEER